MTNEMPDEIWVERSESTGDLHAYENIIPEREEIKYTRSSPDTITLKRKEYDRLIRGIKNIISGEYRSLLKTEKCSHNKYGWEDCELCVIEYLSAALEEKK